MKALSILSIYLFSALFLVADSDFFLVDDYLAKNKNEQEKSTLFAKVVQKSPEPLTGKNSKVKIVMLYPGNQVSDYWRRSKVSFEKRMDELGIKYELVDYFTRPVELTKQASVLNKILSENVDYLIFTLDAKKHAKFVERILNKKRPNIILQNITTPKKKWEKTKPFLYVGFDHVIGAKILADKYIEKTAGEGKYAVLYGPRGYVSKMRGEEFINYVSKKSRLKLTQSYYTNFDKKRSKLATLDLLKREKDLKFIYACSTDIALGAIEALRETGNLGKIMVNGWGGGSSELDAISKGELDFTVMRNNDDNGVAMAEAIKLDLLGKKQQIPTVYSGEFFLVEKGISQEKLESLKKSAFRYSGVK